MSRLVFNEARHIYSLDGEYVPGVTTITKRMGTADGLINWAARCAAEWALAHVDDVPILGEPEWIATTTTASNRIRDARALDGKRVHSIAERLVYGDPVETADPDTGEDYSDDVVRMGEQVARFMDRWDVTADTALVERPVFHEGIRYAGTFDLCAILRGGERWLIDYKSGPSGVYPEHAAQLTAYSRATHVVIGERDMTMPPIARCAALWVRPDTWELIPVKSDDSVWEAFQHALIVSRFTSRRRSDLIGAALPIPEVRAS